MVGFSCITISYVHPHSWFDIITDFDGRRCHNWERISLLQVGSFTLWFSCLWQRMIKSKYLSTSWSRLPEGARCPVICLQPGDSRSAEKAQLWIGATAANATDTQTPGEEAEINKIAKYANDFIFWERIVCVGKHTKFLVGPSWRDNFVVAEGQWQSALCWQEADRRRDPVINSNCLRLDHSCTLTTRRLETVEQSSRLDQGENRRCKWFGYKFENNEISKACPTLIKYSCIKIVIWGHQIMHPKSDFLMLEWTLQIWGTWVSHCF